MADAGKPTRSPSSVLWTVITAVLVIVLVVVLLQRLGVIGGVPLDVQVASTLTGSTPTQEPTSKNIKAYVDKDDPSVKIDTLPKSKWKIIDIHEHAQFEEEAVRMLKAMDEFGVQRTCLQAATIYTYTLNNKYGFEQYKENNEEIIRIKNKWPDRFCAFVTIDPAEAGNLDLLKDYFARGADGIKLYLGHGAATGKGPFHVMDLDDPRMDEIWTWAEDAQVPILLHVNLIKYWDEMISVFEKHPHLRICLPHFGLHKNTEARLNRLGWILDRYPNVYTDLSYGYYTFQIEGFESLAKWRTRSRDWLTRHADRVMFASDMVLEKTKDEAYIENTLRSYRQFNEMRAFRLFLVPSRLMHGMGLDDDTLAKMYEQAPKNFLLLDAAGNLPDRKKSLRVDVPRTSLPPIDLASIPDDVQYKPRSKGQTWASPKTLARALAAQGGEESGNGFAGDKPSQGANGESIPDDEGAEHECH